MTFDLNWARAERDAGMARVLANDPEYFKLTARHLLWKWLRVRARFSNAPFIAEDAWRDVLSDPACPEPRHPNQLGAMWNSIVRAGWIVPTGDWRSPSKIQSHARPCREYKVSREMPENYVDWAQDKSRRSR